MKNNRPGTIEQNALDSGIFPFDAFTFTQPSASVPTLALKSDWKLSAPGIVIMGYLMPAGAILPFGGRAVPTGWLSCGGQAVSRTTYATLYSAISTSWGAGNGTTTFNVPDLRGVGLRGAGANGSRSTATGVSYNGLSVGSAINDQIQGHTLGTGGAPIKQEAALGGGVVTGDRQGAAGTPLEIMTDGTNGTPRTGTETRMATSSVLFIIKS